jgi:phage shock protein A
MFSHMGIFDRMSRVISSNFNALLDKAEDPRKSIELTLEEMNEQIRAARREVVRSVAAEKQLKAKVSELDTEVERWTQRAELAVRHGDDQLAKEALLQKRRATEERDRGEALRAEQRGQALEMKSELERMEQKLAELKARKGTIIAKAQQAKSGGTVETMGAKTGGAAFSDFRRMEAQIEGVEAAIQAQREVDEALTPMRGPTGMSRDEVEAKFRSLEHGGTAEAPASGGGTDVDTELAALKKRVRVEP